MWDSNAWANKESYKKRQNTSMVWIIKIPYHLHADLGPTCMSDVWCLLVRMVLVQQLNCKTKGHGSSFSNTINLKCLIFSFKLHWSRYKVKAFMLAVDKAISLKWSRCDVSALTLGYHIFSFNSWSKYEYTKPANLNLVITIKLFPIL